MGRLERVLSSREFAYWLQGYFELDNTPIKTGLSVQQLETIRRHLAMVFEHEIDPSTPNPKLDQLHAGPMKPTKLIRC